MENFINSGRFNSRKSFLEKNPHEKLHTDCTDVVQYNGGGYIQVLKSGEFYVDENYSSRSLDQAEIMLWGKVSKK